MKIEFLNAKMKKDSSAAKERSSICKDQKLSCDVLITTSVLINGVSLNDESIKHVVLPYSNKTDFLQALGRVRRVSHDYLINVYVRRWSQKEINSKKYAIKNEICALIQCVNTENKVLAPTNSNDPRILADFEYAYHCSQNALLLLRRYNKNHMKQIMKYLTLNIGIDDKNKSSNNDNGVIITNKYSINTAALFHSLYVYMEYDKYLNLYHDSYVSADNSSDAPDKAGNYYEKSLSFFREQLRWLGLENDPKINDRMIEGSISASYISHKNKLQEIIDKYENRQIEKDEQETIRRDLYEELKHLCPDIFHKEHSRYDKGKSLPGKKILNDALKSYGCEIISCYLQRRTVWYLQRILSADNPLSSASDAYSATLVR